MARKPPSPSPGPGWVALNGTTRKFSSGSLTLSTEAPTSDSSGEEDEIVDDNDGNIHQQLNSTLPPRKRKEADQLESLSKRPKHEQQQRLSGNLGSTSVSKTVTRVFLASGARPKPSHSVASGSAAGSLRTTNATNASSNITSAGPRPSSSMLPPPIPAKRSLNSANLFNFLSQPTVSSKVSGKSANVTGSGSHSASQKPVNAEASSSSSKRKEFPSSLSSKLFDRVKLSPTKAGSSLRQSISAKEPAKGKDHSIRPQSITNEFIDVAGDDSPRLSLAVTSAVIDMSDEEDQPRKLIVARKSVGGRMARKPPPSNAPVEVIEISSDSDDEPPPKTQPPSKHLKLQSSKTRNPVQKVAPALPTNTQKKASTSASETGEMNVDVPSASSVSSPQLSGSNMKSVEKLASKRASSQGMDVDHMEAIRPSPRPLPAINSSPIVKSPAPPASSKHQRSLSGLKVGNGSVSTHKESASQDMQVDDVKTPHSTSTTRTLATNPSRQPEFAKPIFFISKTGQPSTPTSKPRVPPASKHVRAPSGTELDENTARKPLSSSQDMEVDGTAYSATSTPIRPQALKPPQQPAFSQNSKTNAPGSSSNPITKPVSKRRESSPGSSTGTVNKPTKPKRPQVAIKSTGGIKPKEQKRSTLPSSSEPDGGSDSDNEDNSSPNQRSAGASSDDRRTIDTRVLDHARGLAGSLLNARTPERTALSKKQPISPELSKISVTKTAQSPSTPLTHGRQASKTSQPAVASGSKTNAGVFRYRGNTIDFAIDLTSDNEDDDLQLNSAATASQKLVDNLSKLKGKGRADPRSSVSSKPYSQTPRSGSDELLLRPSESESSPPPRSSSPPLISPVTPATDFPQTAEGSSRSNADRTRHSAPIVLKSEVAPSSPVRPQALHTTTSSDAIPKAVSPLRPYTRPVSVGSKRRSSIHTVLSEPAHNHAQVSDVQLPPTTSQITFISPPETSTNDTRAKSSPGASRISSTSFEVPGSSTTPLTTTSVTDRAQVPRSMAQDISDDNGDVPGISTDVEMKDPQTSEDDAMQETEVFQALIEDDRDSQLNSSSEPETESELEKGSSEVGREPASAVSEVNSSNEADPTETSSLSSAIRRMSRRSSRSSTNDVWPAPPDEELAEHESGPASRNTTPEDTTAPVRSSGKMLGGFPAITWKEYRQNLVNFTPKCLYNKNLPHSLQDQINYMSIHMQQMPALRDVFQAMILENTIENEPYTPPIQVINDIDEEPTPPWEFHYTNEMWHGEGVPPPDIKSLTSCSCKGACNPRSKTCTCLIHQQKETGNSVMEFAYDKSGRLKEPGYPVFECNDLCGCGDECRNRVVQHGRTVEVVIKKTQYKGWGIFAGSKKIPRGTFIGIYSGELLTDEEAHNRGTDIEPHEEICFDYSGGNDDEGESIKKDDKIYARCMCGAPNCKGKMFI
ncbi:hypothetical protein CVT25_012483 [Psilocybe cyanescens]|uniref:Histone-lysine N-methyltransferase n=1 Tax=Psilocybe cyanescens TaxID=93625 RepID=A0A409XHC8_PSICY|nr:hypothetical protein CVT25_012483 [Psilocybe cyanescens]